MNDWVKGNDQITKTFEFKDFKSALSFVNQVADLAESMNHHPDIFLHNYKQVTLTLSTHSENRVTEKDWSLAKMVDSIYKK